MSIASSDEKIPLKYRWRKTWEDRENDFMGKDPDNLDQFGSPSTIGRFYLTHIPGGTAWRWFVQWVPPGGGVDLPSGVALSKREAAKAIEDAYEMTRRFASNASS